MHVSGTPSLFVVPPVASTSSRSLALPTWCLSLFVRFRSSVLRRHPTNPKEGSRYPSTTPILVSGLWWKSGKFPGGTDDCPPTCPTLHVTYISPFWSIPMTVSGPFSSPTVSSRHGVSEVRTYIGESVRGHMDRGTTRETTCVYCRL